MRHPSSNALQEDIPEKELFPESEELTPDNDSYWRRDYSISRI
jgi:hypothetical protein